MNADLVRFSLVIIAAAVFGMALGHGLLAALITAVAIIVWQLKRYQKLQWWLENPKRFPMPESSGQAYLLYRLLNRKKLQNQQRKRRLSALLSQFRRAVSALPDAIILINQQNKIVWANTNANTLLGIRWPDDNGMRFTDLIRDPKVSRLLTQGNHFEEIRQGIEIRSATAKDQIISIKVVDYADDTRMVVARDVSRLIKVNQIHTDFVANVSHELKTPLTVIKGYVEIMQNSGQLPSQFDKPIEQMNLQAARMQLIVNDLLYLARLENDDDVPQHEVIDLTQLINTIVEAVQPLIEDKRHKLELDIDYRLKVRGAAGELHSAFSNLITNAIHYTNPGGLIRVQWSANKRGASFSVKDTGQGIAAHHIERLTQRFYRVDNDRSRESGGTGLGLAIVKHVLQRHHAELTIESTVGEGSTFACQFPATQVIPEQPTTQVRES